MPPFPSNRRLLLIGWDAADWKVIDPLLAKGEMPHLAKLIAHGVRGNLATLHPPLSPMLWTSIATGKRPFQHGIHGFTEPAEDGLGVRSITNLGRKTKAIWNILNQNGKRSIVAGWWPSHPAEPIRGAMVSNHFPPSTSADPGTPMPRGTVHPESWAQALSDLRVHGMHVTGDMLNMFAPGWGRIDQDKDQSVHDLAGFIAETMSIHCAATELMENEAWDFAAIYFIGLDHFSHRFMRYHAGKPSVKSADSDIFTGIVDNAYRWHDAMLGRLIQLAGDSCPVMLLSDHGFHSDALLPDYIPAEAAGPAVEHREFGIFCLSAPNAGVLRGQRIYGGSVLDIAPTVLHLFGLPAGADMDGKVLINAFKDQTLPAPIPSWDDVAGDDGRHDPSLLHDSSDSAESLKQLVDLGYIQPPSLDVRKNIDVCLRENRYNLARSYLEAGIPDLACGLLRELLAEDPEQGRFHRHLVQGLLQGGDRAAATAALLDFDRAAAAFAPRAAEELQRKQTEQSGEEPDRGELLHRRELTEKATGFAIERLWLRIRLALGEPRGRKKEEARELLNQLASTSDRRGGPALFLAEGFMALGDDDRALEWLRRALRDYPEDWRSLALEARIHFRAKRFGEVVSCSVESLALVYFQPWVHLLLATSLRCLGDDVTAESECRVALAQMPGLAGAHDELARIYRKRGQPGDAGLHMGQAKLLRDAEKTRKTRKRTEQRADAKSDRFQAATPGPDDWEGAAPADRERVVTIVTGLPRSGTSMMMQMLVAAGIHPYTDRAREADEDNPRGYFEHAQAIRLREDKSWLPEVRGKSVKIVAQLLPFLPPGEDYRIVFMRRDMNEVIASQTAMLARLGRKGGNLADAALQRIYTGQLVKVRNWLRKTPGVRTITMDYVEVLGNPQAAARRLGNFLGDPFDTDRAAAAVEQSLRRQTS